MSGGWEPGDLALCVKRSEWRTHIGKKGPNNGPRFGDVCTVRNFGINPNGPKDLAVLWFVEWPGDSWLNAYASIRFIKITPEAADEFDRETIALYTLLPAKIPAHTELGREASFMAPCIASDSREVGTTPARLPAFVLLSHDQPDSLEALRDHN